MDAFYIAGSVLAAWALILAGMGIVSDSFPGNATIERLVAGVTVVLVSAAIAGAIYQASEEPDDGDPGGKKGEAAVLVP